jgi:hypothetical protein
MQPLLNLCFEVVLKLNSYYYDRLPFELLEKLKRLQIQQECSDIVSHNIRIEKSQNYDNFFGYVEKISFILQNKNYVQRNIRAYEMQYKVKNYLIYFPKKPYVLYYLEQETDYKEKYPQKGNIKYLDYAKK